ncbi:SUMF1/EgtB/PvdO family nonheme iron enzyme [Candidatus Latescibacterota bacterium]
MEKCPVCDKGYKPPLPLNCDECGWTLVEHLYFDEIPQEEIDRRNILLAVARKTYIEKQSLYENISNFEKEFENISAELNEDRTKLSHDLHHLQEEIDGHKKTTEETLSELASLKSEYEKHSTELSSRIEGQESTLASQNDMIQKELHSVKKRLEDDLEKLQKTVNDMNNKQISALENVSNSIKKNSTDVDRKINENKKEWDQKLDDLKKEMVENYTSNNKLIDIKRENAQEVTEQFETINQYIKTKTKKTTTSILFIAFLCLLILVAGIFYVNKIKNEFVETFNTVSATNIDHSNTKEQDVIAMLGMVLIPEGTFMMGNEISNSFSHEKPLHSVTLDEFMMSSSEITQLLYQQIMTDEPFESFLGNLPVESTWYDAVRFCNKLSEFFGLEKCYFDSLGVCDFNKNGFRLPTEAEWEYSCKAGLSTDYTTGNGNTGLSEIAWYSVNSGDKDLSGKKYDLQLVVENRCRLHPVKQKQPNRWGLYDMHGNVEEWCYDWYSRDYYSNSPSHDPVGPDTGIEKVTRGGSYISNALYLRSTSRVPKKISGSSDKAGFRVIRSIQY